MINSVSGEGDKIDKIFPILAENKGWQVIALLSDDTGIPKNAADRLRVFDKIMAKAKEYGIAPNRLFILDFLWFRPCRLPPAGSDCCFYCFTGPKRPSR